MRIVYNKFFILVTIGILISMNTYANASSRQWNMKKMPLNYCDDFGDLVYMGKGYRGGKLFGDFEVIMEIIFKIKKDKIVMSECYWYEIDISKFKN